MKKDFTEVEHNLIETACSIYGIQPHIVKDGKSITIILKFLKPKPAREWVCLLASKLESTPKNQPVVFEYRKQSCGVVYSEKKIPVSRIFIEQIIKELNWYKL